MQQHPALIFRPLRTGKKGHLAMSKAKYHESISETSLRCKLTSLSLKRAGVFLLLLLLLINNNIILSLANQVTYESPTVIVGPSIQTGFDGQQLIYTVTVINNDRPGTPVSSYSVMGDFPEPGFQHFPICVTMTLAPGERQSRTVIIKSPLRICSGPKRFREIAVNDSDHSVSGFGEAVFNVLSLGPNCGLGTCMPVPPGHKPKQDLATKTRSLMDNNPVPSAFGAAFYRVARRFLSGAPAANSFEQSAFARLGQLSPDVRDVMACAVRNFDKLPDLDRYRLFSPEITAGGDDPLSPDELVRGVANEVLQRASQVIFGDPNSGFVERPGLRRPVVVHRTGADSLNFAPVICEINGVSVDDSPPTLTQGDGVILKGFNFFNSPAKVVLKQGGGEIETVSAHVFGDARTPADETVAGVPRPIADCRVQDMISFVLPDRMRASGNYQIQIIVPNVTGASPAELRSEEETIHLDVSPSTNFHIRTETLDELKETSPEDFDFFSDEAALKFVVVSEDLNGDLGNPAEYDFRDSDADSGETAGMPLELFNGSGFNFVAVTVVGFEVDSESAFKKQIQGFVDAFVLILKENWDLVKNGYEVGKDILLAVGVPSPLAQVIAGLVVAAIVTVVAIWAPADLLIADTIVLTALNLERLTNPLASFPDELKYKSPPGIDVTVEKGNRSKTGATDEFRHRRVYHSGEEGSRYGINFLYSKP